MAVMKTAIESDTGAQLWGIYYRDREFAREKGDPLRTVISAQTKEEAEQEASRLGFEEPWAHPVTLEETQKAEWLPINVRQLRSRQDFRKGVRV